MDQQPYSFSSISEIWLTHKIAELGCTMWFLSDDLVVDGGELWRSGNAYEGVDREGFFFQSMLGFL